MPNADGSPTFTESLSGLITAGADAVATIDAASASRTSVTQTAASGVVVSQAQAQNSKTMYIVGGIAAIVVLVIYLFKRK
jgi:hypothetical protein